MSFTISLRFPTGKYVAASWNDRDQPEWPPHPARFCLGLIDVLHKSGNLTSDRTALAELFAAGAPSIHLPAEVNQLSQEGYFVPLNPTSFKGSITPGRKPRSFPAVMLDPDHPELFFSWPEFSPGPNILQSLQKMILGLPRFGHSSSLVEAKISEATPTNLKKLIPLQENDFSTPDEMLRTPYSTLLEQAEKAFDAPAQEQDFKDLIAKNSKSPKAGKFLSPSASPRGRHDPIHRWVGYRSALPQEITGPWDQQIIVLPYLEGQKLTLTSTLALTSTLHQTILDRWDRLPRSGPIPEWISGHLANGKTSRELHLALSTVSDVRSPLLGDSELASKHAHGDIKGIALFFPAQPPADTTPASFQQEKTTLMQALFGEGTELLLSPKNNAWKTTFTREIPLRSMNALKPTRWTTPSDMWTTVTPIILDRHPKPHFKKDPVAWAASCAKIIAQSCQNIGLPEPLEVIPDRYSVITGPPPSPAFDPQRSRSGRPPRFHIHASIRFAEEDKITGPLLLGAGRYRGYGQLIPLHPNPSSHS